MMSNKDRVAKQRVWLYIADGRSADDLRDLDQRNSLIWGANEHTRKGDIVLMYRGTPYKDIVYSFEALSNPRRADRRTQSYLPLIITLGKKRRVPRPVTLDDLRADPILHGWSVSRSPQGVMQRRQDLVAEGVWPRLRQLLRYQGDAKAGRRLGAAAEDIFLSYAREDEPKVKRLASRLVAAGVSNTWRDRSHIKPGDDWRKEIFRALCRSRVVVVCLSRATQTKSRREFFNTEVGWAVDLASRNRPRVILVPVKLAECEVPRRLRRWHYAELFKAGGFESLVDRLRF